MLDAARELFASKGFTATTTREIAERATVTEQLLFNHFDSKQDLFTIAVVRPFEDFVNAQLDSWVITVDSHMEPPQMMRRYVAGLYALVLEHQALFRALSADPFGPHIAVRVVFATVTTVALHQEPLLRERTVDGIVDELSRTLTAGLSRRDG